jgi:hypothetical protein
MRFAAAAALLAVPGLLVPGSVAVRSVTDDGAEISIGIFTGEPLESGSRFEGTIRFNGGPPVPLAGAILAAGRQSTLTAALRFDRIPEDLLSHLDPATFEYTLSGHAGPTSVLVSGGGAWNAIAVDAAARNAISRRMTVDDVTLERFSLRRSTVTLHLHLKSPLPFDLRLARFDVWLDSEGRRLGSASREKLLIHRDSVSTIEVPLELEHSALLAAAGAAVFSGGEFSGSVGGLLSVKLGAGDVSFPFHLPVRISLLSKAT